MTLSGGRGNCSYITYCTCAHKAPNLGALCLRLHGPYAVYSSVQLKDTTDRSYLSSTRPLGDPPALRQCQKTRHSPLTPVLPTSSPFAPSSLRRLLSERATVANATTPSRHNNNMQKDPAAPARLFQQEQGKDPTALLQHERGQDPNGLHYHYQSSAVL
ncbi:Structure-specific endonuclease subunit slx4 [Frankliniella fusca]|uniref:Structure-specific endonuclease subunit slx4 n=1 Tax=Frankliniella fusca TaxID=407009 RepID=A0AAE1LR20_9NEOP|nr:Structure-specific endonuclease subunit slx4 [Frankliniella fusca]